MTEKMTRSQNFKPTSKYKLLIICYKIPIL